MTRHDAQKYCMTRKNMAPGMLREAMTAHGMTWGHPDLWISTHVDHSDPTLVQKSTARVPLRKYFIPGCVGRGLDLDLRIRPAAPAPAASGNPSGWVQVGPSGWAQAGPKWVGRSWAHVGGPKLGPSGWAQIWPPWG